MARFLHSVLLILSIIFITCAQAQNPAMSKDTKLINGKKYYIHKVAKGQSLYGIAKIYDVDLNSLIVENPEAIDGIKAGQELKIPAEKSKEQSMPTLKDYEKYVTHKVVKGETVYRICKDYSITEQQLTDLNPDVKKGLKENMVLRIKEKDANKTSTPVVTTNTPVKTVVKETPASVK